MSELWINYELWMNIHNNELHLSCESDIRDINMILIMASGMLACIPLT
jgi:hypothetical protein